MEERIRKALLSRKVNGVRLANILFCSYPTAKKKLDEPKLLTLDDVSKLIIALNISKEELDWIF